MVFLLFCSSLQLFIVLLNGCVFSVCVCVFERGFLLLFRINIAYNFIGFVSNYSTGSIGFDASIIYKNPYEIPCCCKSQCNEIAYQLGMPIEAKGKENNDMEIFCVCLAY